MNRAQRRSRSGRDLRCVVCGSVQARLNSDGGRICVDCHGERSAGFTELSDAGKIVVQPLDPDGRPIGCVNAGCRRDAVTACVIHRYVAAGCPHHFDEALDAARRVQGGAEYATGGRTVTPYSGAKPLHHIVIGQEAMA